MIVRAAMPGDRLAVAEMRRRLWPDEDGGALDAEVPALLEPRDSFVMLVAEGPDERPIGFAEVGVRDYAEGCPGRAGYLEGIWVEPDCRRRGVATALLAAAERWARERGLTHFASDALIDNEDSHGWHAAAGFAEVERVVAFAKPLG